MRIPEWLTAIFTGIQVIVLTALTYYLGWTTEKHEISAFTGQLASDVADDYRPAAYRLVEHGNRGIDRIASFANESCLRWDKEVILYDLIVRSSPTKAQREKALRGVWSAWKCNPRDLGMDVYLYEYLKNNAAQVCAFVQSSLPDSLEVFDEAALIVALDQNCPKQQFDGLKKYRDEISVCTKPIEATPAVRGEVQAVGYDSVRFLDPWPKYYSADWHPTNLQRESWDFIVSHIFEILGGSKANLCVWQTIRTEPLWSKILFASMLAQSSDKQDPPEMKKYAKQLLDGWVKLALTSVDSDAKSTALRAVHALQLREYKQSVERLASNDPNPLVRLLATDVLDAL